MRSPAATLASSAERWVLASCTLMKAGAAAGGPQPGRPWAETVGRDRGLVWLFGQTYQPDQARSNRVERILGNASAAGAIPAAIALGAKRQIKGLGRILKPAKEPQGLLGPG